MQKNLKYILSFLVLLLLVGGLLAWKHEQTVQLQQKNQPTVTFGNGSPFQSVNYPNTIATPSTSSTLTTSYNDTSSSVMIAGGVPNVVFKGTYTPRLANNTLLLRVDRSIDNGITYAPYMTISPGTTSTIINTSGASSTQGTPFVILGGATSTAVPFDFDFTLAADYIHVSAEEANTTTSTTSGLLNLSTLLTD